MNRSEINTIMRSGKKFLAEHQFQHPPFAAWTPAEWRGKGPPVREIVENQLSWPPDHTGWTLQCQTNGLDVSLTGLWQDLAGSTATNQMAFPLDAAQATVFYRLKSP
jgi:hypothetical protein